MPPPCVRVLESACCAADCLQGCLPDVSVRTFAGDQDHLHQHRVLVRDVLSLRTSLCCRLPRTFGLLQRASSDAALLHLPCSCGVHLFLPRLRPSSKYRYQSNQLPVG